MPGSRRLPLGRRSSEVFRRVPPPPYVAHGQGDYCVSASKVSAPARFAYINKAERVRFRTLVVGSFEI